MEWLRILVLHVSCKISLSLPQPLPLCLWSPSVGG